MIQIIRPTILLVGLFLCGCASLQDFFNILSGNSTQKITKTPIWLYKPDLKISIDEVKFYGFGAAVILPQTDIVVDSIVDADRVEVTTCSRHDVCQIKSGELACDLKRFQISTDWFGNPKHTLIYHFIPDAKERDDSCAQMFLAVYDKNALASWGFLAFRSNPERNFPARMTCNAQDILYKGTSACSVKAGTIQEINFDQPIDNFKADKSCGIIKVSDTEFEMQPTVGWCRASFGIKDKYHDLVLNAYDEVLIRDGKQ